MKAIKVANIKVTPAKSIREAAEIAGLDLTGVDQRELGIRIKSMESDSDQFFATADGRVLYIFKCSKYDGLHVLNEFTPGFSCIDNSSFYAFQVSPDQSNILIHSDLPIGRDKATRKWLARDGWTVTTLAA